MRTAALVLLLALALSPLPVVASQGNGSSVPVEVGQRADAVVLKHSASILGIPIGKLRVDRPFANQVAPGDALDIIEIVMAIEDDLDIAIDDGAMDASVGASGVTDIAQRLTIGKLQQVVRSILAQRPDNSFKPKPLRGLAQFRR